MERQLWGLFLGLEERAQEGRGGVGLVVVKRKARGRQVLAADGKIQTVNQRGMWSGGGSGWGVHRVSQKASEMDGWGGVAKEETESVSWTEPRRHRKPRASQQRLEARGTFPCRSGSVIRALHWTEAESETQRGPGSAPGPAQGPRAGRPSHHRARRLP